MVKTPEESQRLMGIKWKFDSHYWNPLIRHAAGKVVQCYSDWNEYYSHLHRQQTEIQSHCLNNCSFETENSASQLFIVHGYITDKCHLYIFQLLLLTLWKRVFFVFCWVGGANAKLIWPMPSNVHLQSKSHRLQSGQQQWLLQWSDQTV